MIHIIIIQCSTVNNTCAVITILILTINVTKLWWHNHPEAMEGTGKWAWGGTEGLNSHFLWWEVSCCLAAQSRPTLCNSMNSSPPGFSVHSISQARILEWVAISFSKGFSQPGFNPSLLHWQILTTEPPRKRQYTMRSSNASLLFKDMTVNAKTDSVL